MRTPRRLAAAVLWLVVAVLCTAPVRGQAPLAIVGQVLDPKIQPLPGALVQATAHGFAESVPTDESGRFRIPVPAAGRYEVTVSLEGFQPVTFVAEIPGEGKPRLAFEVTLDYESTCSLPQIAIEVLSGLPVVSREDAERLPLARNPWTLLSTAPGVLLDRENVAGVEDGRQPSFTSPGAGSESATWIFEGVDVTDRAALGASLTQYDFGGLEEVTVRIGGTDLSLATAGAVLDLRTRRGTNDWRGAARFLVADGSWQSGSGASEGDLARAGGWNLGHSQAAFEPAGRIETVREAGFEAGGPLALDRLWLWGGYGHEDADTLGPPDLPGPERGRRAIDLAIWDAKLNAQATASSSLVGFYHRAENEAAERSEIYKLEATQIFSSSFYLSALAAQVDSGLRAEGQAKLESILFLTSGSASHELRFGAVGRRADAASPIDSESLYLSDIVLRGNLTATAGLRYDRQAGRRLERGVGSGPIEIEWRSVQPRLGLSYALSQDRGTVLEAGYARFAEPLGTRTAHLALRADPGLDPPLTDELALALERSFNQRFLVGARATARRVTGVLEREVLVQGGATGAVRVHRREDYEPVPLPAVVEPLPDGSAAGLSLSRLRPGLVPTGGVALENGRREQEYRGLSLFAEARDLGELRLSGQVTWSDWKWKVPGSEREDPTFVLPAAYDDDGAVLVPAADDERRDVFLSARWSYDLSAVYDVAPAWAWSFGLGARLHGRDGYPLPYYRAVDPGDGLGPRRVLLAGAADALRLDDVHLLDLRVEKTVRLDPWAVTLSLDAFNVADQRTVVQRDLGLGTPSGDFVREVLNPRTLRLGLRLGLR